MRLGQILRHHRIVENAKKKGAVQSGSSFRPFPVFQALNPSIKRYAQTKRLLARRSLGAL